jgi:hypothetical protein
METSLVIQTNDFLKHQDKLGLLDGEAARSLAREWREAGRPPVVEFLYDAATQRRLALGLVCADVVGVRGGVAEVASAMAAWAALVAAFNPRVLCLQDEAVVSLLRALPEVLWMLGAAEGTVAGVVRLRRRVEGEIAGAV